MGKVSISDSLLSKLENMVYILFEKQYFGSIESSEEYVSKIVDFIYAIPNQLKRKTKKPKHGVYYARFDVKNKRTSYYITFDVKGDRYLVENIFTSHERGYATYIRGVK